MTSPPTDRPRRPGRPGARAAWLVAGLALGTLAAPATSPAQPEALAETGSTAELECLIEPWERVTVSAPVEGRVQRILVDRGDEVRAGQAVARLEATVEHSTVRLYETRAAARGAIERWKAQLDLAQRTLERQATLELQEIGSVRDREEAESARAVAEAALQEEREAHEAAKLELERARAIHALRTIRSPIDGVVVKRILAEGEYADPPELVEIAKIDPLRVEVFAPHSLFGKIVAGMPVLIRPEGQPEVRLEARVTVADPVIDPASGTFGIRLELPNPDRTIPAGLSCRAEFDLGRTAAGD